MKQPHKDTIDVNSLTDFVALLTAWHARKVKTLEHMLQIPEGTPMQVDGGEEVPLTGEILAGFRAGISVSLAELGTLPFAAELEPDTPKAG